MSKGHTTRVFQLLSQMAADKQLPSSAFRVGYVLAQCWNEKAGEASPGTDYIATQAGLSQSTVRENIQPLIDCGHFEVTWGSKGRGHPNRYRPVLKERTSAISTDGSKQRTTTILDDAQKQRLEGLKIAVQRPKIADLRYEPLRTTSAPPARSSEFVATLTQISSCGTRADAVESSSPIRTSAPAFGGAFSVTLTSDEDYFEQLNERMSDDEIPY